MAWCVHCSLSDHVKEGVKQALTIHHWCRVESGAGNCQCHCLSPSLEVEKGQSHLHELHSSATLNNRFGIPGVNSLY